MLKLNKRSGCWYVTGTMLGERVRRSTGLPLTAKKDAFAILKQIEDEVIQRHLNHAEPSKTLIEAVEAYLGRPGGYSSDTKRMTDKYLQYWPTHRLDEITSDEITQYAHHSHYEGGNPKNKPGTIKRDLSYLKAVLNHAQRIGWLDRVPFIDMPIVNNKRMVFLNDQEVTHLLDTARDIGPHLTSLLIFLIYTGARLGEALTLEWSQVDFNREEIVLTSRKGRKKKLKYRTVPLHAKIIAELERVLPEARIGRVFRNSFGKPWALREHNNTGSPVRKVWERIRNEAGMPHVRIHDLRHTFASRLRMQGAPLETIAELLGHSSLDMTMRYAHVAPTHLRETIQTLS